MQRLLLVVLTLSVMTACAGPSGQDLATAVTLQTASETEEYAVYSALITARYIGDETQLIVIRDHTGLSPSNDLDSRLEYVQQSLPDLTEEIITNFKVKNQQSHPLRSLFTLSVEYILISREEIREIFQSGDGWEKFYMKYPNSQGEMTLSRVGFNANMDRALVYVGNQYHWLAGSGHFVILIKENGTWTAYDEIMAWISQGEYYSSMFFGRTQEVLTTTFSVSNNDSLLMYTPNIGLAEFKSILNNIVSIK